MKIKVNEAKSFANPSDCDFVVYDGGTGAPSIKGLRVVKTLEEAHEIAKKEWPASKGCASLRLPESTPLENLQAVRDAGGEVALKPSQWTHYLQLSVPGVAHVRLGHWGEELGPTTTVYLVKGQWVSEAEAKCYYLGLLKT